jgi:hypothetical protein
MAQEPHMYLIRIGLLCTAVFAFSSAVALAAAPPNPVAGTDQAATHDHTQAAAGSTAKPDATVTMQKMQAMHEKMMAAKKPEERAALMHEHMVTMQDGMTMMQKMPMPSGNDATSQRMDMMQMMMQMMMDHMSMPMTMPNAHKPEAPK